MAKRSLEVSYRRLLSASFTEVKQRRSLVGTWTSENPVIHGAVNLRRLAYELRTTASSDETHNQLLIHVHNFLGCPKTCAKNSQFNLAIWHAKRTYAQSFCSEGRSARSYFRKTQPVSRGRRLADIPKCRPTEISDQHERHHRRSSNSNIRHKRQPFFRPTNETKSCKFTHEIDLLRCHVD
jgi:hypothetical protein